MAGGEGLRGKNAILERFYFLLRTLNHFSRHDRDHRQDFRGTAASQVAQAPTRATLPMKALMEVAFFGQRCTCELSVFMYLHYVSLSMSRRSDGRVSKGGERSLSSSNEAIVKLIIGRVHVMNNSVSTAS